MYARGSEPNGFSLAEVLIVTGIIGILASLLLISIDSTRDKAADSRFKIETRSVQTRAEIFFEEKGFYNNFSGADGTDICREKITLDVMRNFFPDYDPDVLQC